MLRSIAIITLGLLTTACILDSSSFGRPEEEGADGDTDADQEADVEESCRPTVEACNGVDDDCDGEVDENFDLQTDSSNCGACGRACSGARVNGWLRCRGGQCLLDCASGFSDCDGDVGDGCETTLSSPSSCGGCDQRCEPSTPLCQVDPRGEYQCVSACEAPTTLCDSSCVDVDSDAANCGGCSVECAAPEGAEATCREGDCGFDCLSGLHDCNGLPADGCESDLLERENCGACGVPCAPTNALGSCETGECQLVGCSDGFENCNGRPVDGCEASLDAPATCGSCEHSCSSQSSCGCNRADHLCTFDTGWPCYSRCARGQIMAYWDCYSPTDDSACASDLGSCLDVADCGCWRGMTGLLGCFTADGWDC